MPDHPEPSDPNSIRRAWSLILVAVVLEIGWAIGLPFTEGFSRPGWSVLVLLMMIGAFVPLAKATRVLPIGPAYAVWTGSGAAGAAILGWLVHKEPVTVLRILGIALVVIGVVGLRLQEPKESGT